MLLRRVSTIVAAIATFGGASIFAQVISPPEVVAQTPTTSPRQNSTSKSTEWLQELNLTPQQIQQIKTIRKQAKDQIIQKRLAVRQAHQELHDLMAGNASTEQVRDKYNQLKILRQQLADAEFENTVAIRDVLNTQQRQKYASHMYKR